MNLTDLVSRQPVPVPWAEGEKIPWDDPEFSRRMLQEHLSQSHDAASRRFEIIDRHVDWIHNKALAGKPTRLLDLGCGPGLYTSRFALLGHECMGIDFSPASIAYANQQAQAQGLRCAYIQQDIRQADFGSGYGLVLSIFGEFNVFNLADARLILEKAYRALADGGILLLEPHSWNAVRKIGSQPASWYSSQKGLFSDRPYLCLTENFWDATRAVAMTRHFIVDAQTGAVTRHVQNVQAYTVEQYRALLESCGFGGIAFFPSLDPAWNAEKESDLIAIVARKKQTN